MSNLWGLCHSCHNAKTKLEDGEDWSAELEAVLATLPALPRVNATVSTVRTPEAG